MYLLFVDESGTHGASPVFVLGGIAVHERDAHPLQLKLEQLVRERVAPREAESYELHASEMRNAKKPKVEKRSPWAAIHRQERLAILNEAYTILKTHQPVDPRFPTALFGVAMDRNFKSDKSAELREQYAYEVLLNKFDVMIKRMNSADEGIFNQGLVIHDRRVVERDIQQWTANWRVAAGKLRKLRHLADVPLFSDSKASRLIQAADLVSYAIFRYYASQSKDKEDRVESLWELFGHAGGLTHGFAHYTPGFEGGDCWCRPCRERLIHEAQQQALPSLDMIDS